MLSVSFTDTKFRDDAFIEGWGWDEARGRYNYYRMDGGKWKFRGSSKDTAQFGKANTCFACHLNGAPIMKELLIPWNHCHSRDLPVRYFDTLQPNNKRWPIVDDARFKQLSGARFLDSSIRESIANFNSRRIVDAVQGDRLKDAQGILKHLFKSTEFNIISASQESNMHPLSPDAQSKPAISVAIPNSFFLNSGIIGGGGFSGFTGLAIGNATGFQASALRVKPDEYKKLVDDAALKINGQPGDAHFAWLVPETSDIDNQMVEKLMSELIVPAHFVAAALAVDLKTPVLSKDRAGLLKFIPTEFEVDKTAAAGDRLNVSWFEGHDLTKKVVSNLEAVDLTGNVAAQDFLSILKMENGRTPKDELEKRVDVYLKEITDKLTGPNRELELKLLFDIAIKRRKDVLDDPRLGVLDETGGKLLFPGK